MYQRRYLAGRGSSLLPRLIIGAVVAVISLVTYFGAREYNSVTNEVQHIDMTVEQEIALGLQAAPEMAAQFGGLDPDESTQALVDRVGEELVARTAAGDTPYDFEFYVLADPSTINAFALPGGPVFITRGLLSQLETEGQLAGVLGHEIGHVVARHSAEQIAKTRLTEGLTGAAVIAAYDPNDPSSQQSAQVAALIGQLVTLKFGRDDELEADRLGVRFMAESSYDPHAMVRVMEILEATGQGPRPPEFFSTHPDPGNRIERIEAAIAEQFPNGVPPDLKE